MFCMRGFTVDLNRTRPSLGQQSEDRVDAGKQCVMQVSVSRSDRKVSVEINPCTLGSHLSLCRLTAL